MAQSNGDEELVILQQLFDSGINYGRNGGMLEVSPEGALERLQTYRKQHELELLDRLERRQVTPAEYIYPVVPMSAIKVERERLGK